MPPSKPKVVRPNGMPSGSQRTNGARKAARPQQADGGQRTAGTQQTVKRSVAGQQSQGKRNPQRRTSTPLNSMTHSKNDRTFKVIKVLFVLLALSLIAWMCKLMLVDREEISSSAHNPRMNDEEQTVVRGSILAENGEKLAYTEIQENGSQRRVYPYGEALAHVTGYIGHGKAGLEEAVNARLLEAPDLLDTLKSWAKEEAVMGSSVVTTIDLDLQQFIYEQLDGYKGAVVITEPTTGKVKALVSTPSYHPEEIIDNWDNIAANEDSPLYARATQGLYPPGSTFKMITALTMYRNMKDYEDYTYECEGAFNIGEESISCAKGNVHGDMDLTDGFAYSCNGYFAGMGVELGGDALRKTAEYIHMGDSFGFELPQSSSSVVVSSNDSDGLIAQTAIGQGETQMTPFMLNMLTASVANEGVLYTPYLVDRVIDAEGNQIEKNLPKLWGTVMKPDEAQFLEELMGYVTEYGTASDLWHDSCQIYGKTGTAQVDSGEDHSWFTGYTKVDEKVDLAITILIENGGSDKKAVPLAQEILSRYYGS